MRPILACSVLFVAACAPTQPPPPASPAPALSASAAPAPAPSSSAAPAASAGYKGHGATSVPPEVLAKYAPPPLDPEVARRIQAMLDVRSPGAGIPSPDGKHLFFSWAITGVRQVWRLDGPRSYPVQMTGGLDMTVIEEITPDGATLVLKRDRNGEENPGVYLQKATGGPLTVVQHKPGVQTVAQFVTDDGRWLYFKANDVKTDSYVIYRYDLKTAARETVFDQPGLWNVDDHQPDGRLLLRKETGGASAEYFEWDSAKKALRPLFGQGEVEDWSAQYGADGDVIARAPHGADFYRLWRWRSGAFTAISPDVKHDIEGFSVDPKRQRILFTVNEDGYTRVRGMDARGFKPIAMPKLPEAESTWFGVHSLDGRFTTLRLSSARMPYTSFVYDWKGAALVQWNLPNTPEIDTSKFAVRTLESYPARDGTKIPMFVRRPASCASQPCPVVVEFHGGPEGQSMAGFDTWGQMFVDAGFVLVEPNVRGSSGYGKAWLHADDGAKRLDVITDIEDAAKHIRTAFAVNGKAPRIGITGGSYGGYSTLIGMTMFAGAYDAGAEVVGISNLVTFLRNTAPYRRILRTSEYGDPDKDLEVLQKLSPTTYLDRVKAPLLLIQGAADPRVPVGEAIQMHDALAARKIDAPLIIFADEGHGSQKRQNQVQQIGQVIAFFQRHLQGR